MVLTSVDTTRGQRSIKVVVVLIIFAILPEVLVGCLQSMGLASIRAMMSLTVVEEEQGMMDFHPGLLPDASQRLTNRVGFFEHLEPS